MAKKKRLMVKQWYIGLGIVLLFLAGFLYKDFFSAALKVLSASSNSAAVYLTKNSQPPTLLSWPGVPGIGYMSEIPPVIIQGGWRNYLVGSLDSYSCAAPWGLFDAGTKTWPYNKCTQILNPQVDDPSKTYSFTQATTDQYRAFDKNYTGIFSAQRFTDATQGPSILAITHNENKGEAKPYLGGGQGPFLNSVSRTITNLVGGVTGANCTNENQGCYFGFVGMAWIPENASTNWGQVPFWSGGPIVWPSLGYVSADGTKKLSNGPRHPHSIIANGYVYVFYQDHFWTNGSDGNSALDVGARRSGLKVIRAQLPNVSPGNWYAYYKGSFSQPALPAGAASNFGQGYFSTPGPMATPLFSVKNPNKGSSETQSFAVAKVNGQNLYLGAEVYTDYGDATTSNPLCIGKESLALRYSTNLIKWSNRIPVYGCVDLSTFNMNYAEFVNTGSTDNYNVDLSDFYLLGSYHNSDGSFSYYTLRLGLSQ